MRFGDRVRRGLKIENGAGLDDAIRPVMHTRGTGDTALAELIASTWNSTTGSPYSGTLNMIPAVEREAILQRRKAALVVVEQKKEKEAAVRGEGKEGKCSDAFLRNNTFKAGSRVAIGTENVYRYDSFNCRKDIYYLTGLSETAVAGVSTIPGDIFRQYYRVWYGDIPAKKPDPTVCTRCNGSGKITVSETIDRGGTNQIGGTNYYLTTPAYKEVVSHRTTCDKCFGTGKKRR
jgi:hypothetical protein